jgi:phosphopantetheinyl transferase
MPKKFIAIDNDFVLDESLPTVRVFTVSTEGVDLDEALDMYKEFISPKRMKKIIRLAHMSDKKLSFCSELALCFALGSLSLPFYPPEYEYDEWGKPYLTGIENVYMNISHSGTMAACVIASIPISVDVLETDYYISDDFKRKVVTQSDKEPCDKRELLSLWTKKESYVKLTGKGLRTSMLSFSVNGEKAISHIGGKEAFISSVETDGYFVSTASYEKVNVEYLMFSKEDFSLLIEKAAKQRLV